MASRVGGMGQPGREEEHTPTTRALYIVSGVGGMEPRPRQREARPREVNATLR